MNFPLPGVLILLVGTASQIALAAPSDAHFHFKMPHAGRYRVDESVQQPTPFASAHWIKAWPEDGSTNFVELGNRVVLQVDSADDLKRVTQGSSLVVSRVISSNIFVLEATDALSAAKEAHRLAALPSVRASYPVFKRQAGLNSPYAPRSNDQFSFPYFFSSGGQRIEATWWIENIDLDGTRLGVDLNVMAAWPYGAGQGVTVAVADCGLEMNHPELVSRLQGAPHFNFSAQDTNTTPKGGDLSDPYKAFWTHGTSVAGLIAAEANNGRGIMGVAPQSHLAAWVIFNTNLTLVSDEELMDVYQYANQEVAIQNHSWGSGVQKAQAGPSLLEQVGIANAVTLGRNGLGSVLVRSAGNDRPLLARADDESYPDDPQVIAVAAVTKTGRATDYSEPGACILVAAPGGGGDTPQGLFTTDLVGWLRGVNSGIIYGGDLNDYRWGVQGFIGTSAAAPLVSGVAALILSVNTNLSYRDVQQIIALSARHWDLADPDIRTNGAGFVVSHDVGFGVPDAGHAVWLARTWSNRPPLNVLSITDSQPLAIPDNGLRVETTGSNIPPSLESISAFPTFAPHPDEPTPALPLIAVGTAATVPGVNLTNRAALILRDDTPFETKIANAAKAGAAFAVIYDSTNGGSFDFGLISQTHYAPIPAVFIGNLTGESLRVLFQTNASARVRLHLQSAEKTFHINSTLLCEQVGVRVLSDHPLRGDLRITLRSPQGTRSVLQQFNDDTNPGPTDWTYWSTHHLFESSAGDWTFAISDESPGATGAVRSVSLVIRGVQITDSDHDGLDDGWENARLGSLAFGAKDDPDRDGFSNMREQLAGMNPLAADVPFKIDSAAWELFGNKRLRLSSPASPLNHYEVWGGSNITSLNLITNIPGHFPEVEWFTPSTTLPENYFRVRAVPNP